MRTLKRVLIGLVIAVPLMAALVVGGAWSREAWLASRPLAVSATSIPASPPASSASASASASGSGSASASASTSPAGSAETQAALVAKGAYLARVGNCAGCHSPRGGAPMAGGLPLPTPFGTLFSSNLTPDPETGLGRWSADDFWRAMHHGRSRDGRLLYPAFPYTSYTAMTREDADAIFAWLRAQPAVKQAAPAHQLGWPYRWQSALAVWRLMYFTPGDEPVRSESMETRDDRQVPLARGRYLVQALGHCAECHAPRNRLGALEDAAGLRGGWVGVQGWIAPSLADPKAAGVQDWREDEVAAWLKAGWSPRATAVGPMADVVAESLQHLSDEDAKAMAVYLRGLPREGSTTPLFKPASPAQLDLGRQVYARYCVDCHGDRGQGRSIDGQPAYPPLAGNRAVTLAAPENVVQVLANGGYAPSTASHPRPFGMPPLRQVLTEAEMAAVATLIRQSWGNEASEVTEQDVLRLK
ncbi:c-type cytochrome [Roseateles chitosanitabidus]|uniref:c-type cytochrome n=1 Tax=Roseateles chitosanitabidus TaxID=65048 RepID=UPI001FDFD9D9|nr:c-type cytochrome [Roseateles chitosanitabidus]